MQKINVRIANLTKRKTETAMKITECEYDVPDKIYLKYKEIKEKIGGILNVNAIENKKYFSLQVMLISRYHWFVGTIDSGIISLKKEKQHDKKEYHELIEILSFKTVELICSIISNLNIGNYHEFLKDIIERDKQVSDDIFDLHEGKKLGKFAAIKRKIKEQE